MPRTGLFDSLRRLLHTTVELAGVRLELLVADLELEKLRLVAALLRALLGLLLIGLGLVLLDIKRPRMANFLPSLVVAPLLVALAGAVGINIYPFS